VCNQVGQVVAEGRPQDADAPITWVLPSVRVAKAALATLQRGQAVYAPADGQRTADLNPAGAEVPT
jgi:hypothetical protein